MRRAPWVIAACWTASCFAAACAEPVRRPLPVPVVIADDEPARDPDPAPEPPALHGPFGEADQVALAKPLPDIELGLLGSNGTLSRASLEGKVALLYVTATWVDASRRALVDLAKLAARRGDAVSIYVIDVGDDDAAYLTNYYSQLGTAFPIAVDTDQRVAEALSPSKLPTTFIVDRASVVRYVFAGYAEGDVDRIDSALQTLLSPPH